MPSGFFSIFKLLKVSTIGLRKWMIWKILKSTKKSGSWDGIPIKFGEISLAETVFGPTEPRRMT